jgi:hypothetical protein
MPRSAYYTQTAAHMRELAAKENDAQLKAQLLDLAQRYEKLAQYAEDRGRDGERP